jgi:putative cardiolipin synthase
MLVKLLLFAALFALLSIAALYSYGRALRNVRWARRARPLPVAADATLLDRVLAPQLAQRPQQAARP